MIDTTSINYAINKVSEGWAKVAPTIQDVGEKYVRYAVTKQMITGGGVILAMLLGLACSVALLVKGKKWVDEDAIAPIVVSALGAMVGCMIGICGVPEIRDAVLAYTNPEMFTVHQIIEAAK